MITTSTPPDSTGLRGLEAFADLKVAGGDLLECAADYFFGGRRTNSSVLVSETRFRMWAKMVMGGRGRACRSMLSGASVSASCSPGLAESVVFPCSHLALSTTCLEDQKFMDHSAESCNGETTPRT